MSETQRALALLGEVDRQLGDQRAQADAFATRSGLLIAATAVLTGVLSGVMGGGGRLPPSLLWIVGIGAVTGVLVLCMSRIAAGPSTTQVSLWMSQNGSVDDHLLQSKLLAIEANSRALARAEVMFLVQAAATVAGVIAISVRLRGHL